MDINLITEKVLGAAIEVHRLLGPGLLESAYETCLSRELELRGLDFRRQVDIPLQYKGQNLECGYRVDLVVEDRVVIEVKAIGSLLPIHEAQLLTYLRLGGWTVGLLLNFNVPLMKQGVKRLVHNHKEPSASSASLR